MHGHLSIWFSSIALECKCFLSFALLLLCASSGTEACKDLSIQQLASIKHQLVSSELSVRRHMP